MTDRAKRKIRLGISLRFVIIIMFIIGVAVSMLLLVSMTQTNGQYDEMLEATNTYIDVLNNAFSIRDVINTQNERARNFVITGNSEDVIRYFNELQVERARDTAMEAIQEHLDDEKVIKHLMTAIQLSDRMMTMQYHAMRLAIEGYGDNVNKYPADLRSVELTEEELAMTSEEQLAKARELLFLKDYTLLRNQVEVRIDLCKNELVVAMDDRHQASANKLEELLDQQRNLVVAMMVTLLLVLIFVLSLVVYPISKLIRGIQDEGTVEPKGAAEIRFLAETYNRMHDRMEDANAKLSYEASHDVLTGLLNRTAYEEIGKQDHDIALLLVDVDLFKNINDTYGHDIGDRVLKNVAQVLLKSFRGADKVCRIGGDEFAVIMVNVSSSVQHVIQDKIARAAEVLANPEGGLPPVTLSVGVAFSDQLKEGEILNKNADRALYRVKENGRNGCEFYSELV